MPANFDPYHAWLGIPVGTRPLNHYQLLGLKPFASEPPVIAEAAEAQTSKVKAHVSGPHGSTANLVINEIAAARGVLLNATTRRSYDALLRKELSVAEAPAARPVVAVAHKASAGSRTAAAKTPVQTPARAAPVVAVPVVAAAPIVPTAVAVQAMPMQAVTPAINVALAVPVGSPTFGGPYQAAPTGPSIRKTVHRRRSNPAAAIVAVAVVILGGSGALTYVFRNELSAAFDNAVGGKQTAQSQGTDATPKSTIRIVRKNDASGAVSSSGERSYNDVQESADGSMKTDELANRFGSAMQDLGSPTSMKDKPTDVAADTEAKFGFRPDMNTVTKANSSPVKTDFVFPGTKATTEETEAVNRGLALVRAALANRDPTKAQEQLDLAYLDAVSGESLLAVDRTRQLVELVATFWGAVREGVKGLSVAAEITAGDTIAIVTDIDGDKLGLRVAGQNRDYSLSKLPTALARAIAERWLAADDPNTPVVIAAFIAVEPKGNIDEARDLLSKAAAAGVDVEDLRRELDAIKK